MPSQMGADAFGQQGGVGFADFIGITDEGQTADDFPDRILEARQPEALHLGPVDGDVLQVLGVGAKLLEQPPGFLHRAERLLGLRLFFAGADQITLA